MDMHLARMNHASILAGAPASVRAPRTPHPLAWAMPSGLSPPDKAPVALAATAQPATCAHRPVRRAGS